MSESLNDLGKQLILLAITFSIPGAFNAWEYKIKNPQATNREAIKNAYWDNGIKMLYDAQIEKIDSCKESYRRIKSRII